MSTNLTFENVRPYVERIWYKPERFNNESGRDISVNDIYAPNKDLTSKWVVLGVAKIQFSEAVNKWCGVAVIFRGVYEKEMMDFIFGKLLEGGSCIVPGSGGKDDILGI